MSLIRWQPLKELDTLRQQMNHLMDELVHGERDLNPFARGGFTWTPAIELKETDTDLIVKVEIPGIDAQDLDVQVSEDSVSIIGEHREEKHAKEEGILRSELHYGRFQRILPLPVLVKNQDVRADFKNGMLTLVLPKAEADRRNVTKVDLTMQEKIRETAAGQRQREEQLEEKVHTRAAADVKTPMSNGIPAETRDRITEQRLHDDHLQQTTHQRAVEDVSKPATL